MHSLQIILDISNNQDERPTYNLKATSIQDAIDQSIAHFSVIGVFYLTTEDNIPLTSSTFSQTKVAVMKISPAFLARQSVMKLEKCETSTDRDEAFKAVIDNLKKPSYAREFFKTSTYPPPFTHDNVPLIKAGMLYVDGIKLLLNDEYVLSIYTALCSTKSDDFRLTSAEILTVLCVSGGQIFFVYAAKVYAQKHEEERYRALCQYITDSRLGAVILALLLAVLKCAPEGRRSRIVAELKYVGIADLAKKLKSYKPLVSNFEKALKDDSQIVEYENMAKKQWKFIGEIRDEAVGLKHRKERLNIEMGRAIESSDEIGKLWKERTVLLNQIREEDKVMQKHMEVKPNLSVTIRKLTRDNLIDEIAKNERDIKEFMREKERYLKELENEKKEKLTGEPQVTVDDKNAVVDHSEAQTRKTPRGNFFGKRLGQRCTGKIGTMSAAESNITVNVPLPELKWNKIVPKGQKNLWNALPIKDISVADVERSFKTDEQFATSPSFVQTKYVDLCILRNKFPSSVSLALDITNFYFRLLNERDAIFMLKTLKGLHLSDLDTTDGGKGVEGWLRPLLEIPAFQTKLKMWVESMLLQTQVNKIFPMVKNCQKALDMVKTSRNFKELLSIILSTGNYLNSDYPSIRQVDGFQIDLLIKLKETRLPQQQIGMLEFVLKMHPNVEGLIEELSLASNAKVDFDYLIAESKRLTTKCAQLKQIIQTELVPLPGKEQENIAHEINTMMVKVVALRDEVIKTAKTFYQTMYWINGIPSVAVEYTPFTFFGILEDFRNQCIGILEDKTELKPSISLITRAQAEVMKREKTLKIESEDDLLAVMVDLLKKGKIKSSILRKILS
ncbi:hypothetical protein EIN_398310 [Entamoeba invadens IP1]|uniref:FH2 domain-containing protein n=1 Tax=Entamoeba invadens IP1 TaxID=370355 RepID=A0A0A1UDL9_ENTIV|nr:hypothetical protein EIN_398310 [Entamoeba invadens IP1]ELP91901.1 hypothetical protein EIN_398310 [Entamoeba invadens IP1]|eukprot:XP_004258672.1 hypothetical protein EIN_398310 [Entamoeba invadens IP1]